MQGTVSVGSAQNNKFRVLFAGQSQPRKSHAQTLKPSDSNSPGQQRPRSRRFGELTATLLAAMSAGK